MVGIAFTEFDPLLYVGNCKDTTQPYAGLIDELKLYNHPVDAYTAAQFYIDVVGGSVCVEPMTAEEGDLNDDCKVDLADVAILLAEWLECGLYPLTVCP